MATLARISVTMAVPWILLLSSGMLCSFSISIGALTNRFSLCSTNTALPYCNTISFPEGIMDVFCNNVDITGIQAALTTYHGESSRIFSALTLTTPASTSANDVTSSTPSPSSTPTPSATGTGGDGGGGGDSGNNGSGGDNNGGSNNGGSSDGSNDNGSKSGGGSKSNTGAIVGGVVGGVGGLALIGLAAFFFLRRRKSTAGHEPVNQSPPAPIYTSPPMQQTPQGFYDPKFAAATGQQPYPPPNQQYVQPQEFYTPAPQPSVSPVDPRYSTAQSSTSPAPSGQFGSPVAGGFQPQENVIHEAPAQPSENHRGEMHELA